MAYSFSFSGLSGIGPFLLIPQERDFISKDDDSCNRSPVSFDFETFEQKPPGLTSFIGVKILSIGSLHQLNKKEHSLILEPKCNALCQIL